MSGLQYDTSLSQEYYAKHAKHTKKLMYKHGITFAISILCLIVILVFVFIVFDSPTYLEAHGIVFIVIFAIVLITSGLSLYDNNTKYNDYKNRRERIYPSLLV